MAHHHARLQYNLAQRADYEARIKYEAQNSGDLVREIAVAPVSEPITPPPVRVAIDADSQVIISSDSTEVEPTTPTEKTA